MIDLRSDTVTKPTPAMMHAIATAVVGDDVYGEDPTVNALQEMVAEMFGMEAAMYCPTGTMTNQAAVKAHTQPGDEVVCASNAHVYKYEGGGIAFNSGVQVKSIEGDRGRINAREVEEAINGDDVHFPSTRLVCLENTSNRGGGSIYDFNAILEIRDCCDKHNLALHLDGARLFNALVETKETTLDYGKVFDSISICLSKGLGAPIGSLLLGKKDFIQKARRVRKVFGGGMRQAGFMAAAGIYALNHHVERLKEDHLHARQIADKLKSVQGVSDIMPVETNIIIFSFADSGLAFKFHEWLKKQGVLCGKISTNELRFVFHLDVQKERIAQLEEILSGFKGE